jgi:hypothetical protein
MSGNNISIVEPSIDVYRPLSPVSPGRAKGYTLDLSNNPLTRFTTPSGARILTLNNCGLTRFRAGEYSINVTCDGNNPVTNIDFSGLGTVNADMSGSSYDFSFQGANMKTQAVDSAFNSFPLTFLQQASGYGINVIITGASEPPSANSFTIRNTITAGGGIVVTN